MRNILLTAIAAVALSPAPAIAQTAPKAGGTVAAGDHAFVKEAAAGGLAEVDFGKLAKDKGSSADVKQFGERMATDHGKANDELRQWAQQKNLTLPTELDAKHKATHDRLAKLSGDAFDKAYMHEMLLDHKQDVAKFKQESRAAQDPDLKTWAAQTLPTLEDHLKMAQDTAAKVGAATATGTSGHKGHKKHKHHTGNGAK